MDVVAIPKDVAKARGIKKWYSATPCPKCQCHSVWVSGGCYECKRIKVKNRDSSKYEESRKAHRSKPEVRMKEAERTRLDRVKHPEKYAKYDKTKQKKIRSDPVKLAKERVRQLNKQKRAYAANPEKYKDLSRDYYHANRESMILVGRMWKKNNPDKVRELNLKWNHIDRAARKKRLPKWLSDADRVSMTELYKEARSKGMHVDHIIPLQGKLVSGLHVPSNLQLLTVSENTGKKNYYKVD